MAARLYTTPVCVLGFPGYHYNGRHWIESYCHRLLLKLSHVAHFVLSPLVGSHVALCLLDCFSLAVWSIYNPLSTHMEPPSKADSAGTQLSDHHRCVHLTSHIHSTYNMSVHTERGGPLFHVPLYTILCCVPLSVCIHLHTVVFLYPF